MNHIKWKEKIKAKNRDVHDSAWMQLFELFGCAGCLLKIEGVLIFFVPLVTSTTLLRAIIEACDKPKT